MEKLFDALLDKTFREKFLESKTKNKPNNERNLALKDYILGEGLCTDVERLRRGDYFLDLPYLIEVEKNSTGEKRTLFVFRGTDYFLLSYMSYTLLCLYDHLFSDSLYSFRRERNRRTLIERVHSELKNSDEHPYYAFKTDIKGYAKNIDQDILLRKLSVILEHDPNCLRFLSWLIQRNRYRTKDQTVDRNLSAMPGCPLADFFTNVYLMDVDAYFEANCDLYCRFTDDILVLCHDDQKTCNMLIHMRDMMRENKLELKPIKTELFSPNEPIELLGIRFDGPHMDISRESMESGKLALRINAKKAAQAIRKSGISREDAARRYIAGSLWPFMKGREGENRYFARLFYPVVTRDDSFREIDHCLQHCVRYILTGKWGKAQYRATYAKLRSLGYISVVHLYHNIYKQDHSGL